MKVVARIVAVMLLTLGILEGFTYFVVFRNRELQFHFGIMATLSLGLSGIMLAILATRPNE